MLLKILLGWFAFLLVVYAFMWIDHLYYRYNMPTAFRRIVNTLTEED